MRHSSSNIDRATPARHWDLSAEGVERAARLAELLARELAIDAVYSSSELKARATAAPIAARAGVTVIEDARLNEHTLDGFLERDAFERGLERYFACPDRVVFGSESADAVYGRLAAALHDVHAPAVVVSHGRALTTLVSRCTGQDPLALWRSLAMPAYVVFDRTAWAVQRIETSPCAPP